MPAAAPAAPPIRSCSSTRPRRPVWRGPSPSGRPGPWRHWRQGAAAAAMQAAAAAQLPVAGPATASGDSSGRLQMQTHRSSAYGHLPLAPAPAAGLQGADTAPGASILRSPRRAPQELTPALEPMLTRLAQAARLATAAELSPFCRQPQRGLLPLLPQPRGRGASLPMAMQRRLPAQKASVRRSLQRSSSWR